MKKALVIISLVVIAYSCGNNPQPQQQQAIQAATEQAKQATLDSVKAADQKQNTIDSLKTIVAKDSIKKEETQPAKTDANTSTSASTTTTVVHHKKGWNSTAKGAVIGAGAGGITGALVSKHKVAGALIGTALGAGAGAGTGAIIDNNKKKKQHKENNQ